MGNKKYFITILIFTLSLNLAVVYHCYAQQDNDTREYILVPNDIVEISVYGEPDLSVKVKVAYDGTITFPLLGNIKVAGLTAKELEKNIAELLGEDYLVAPQVNILVQEYASKITILGQVKSPGSYEIKGNLNLTAAIALAGGFTETADTSKVKIIRDIDGKKETLEVNTDNFLGQAGSDVAIRASDTIVVGECGRVFIMGQVIRPGVYSLGKDLTVTGAISLAGGFTPTAAPDGTRVIRIEDGNKKIIHVPAGSILKGGDASKNISLKDNDTIVIPESFF